jgi:hypothetical protein
MWAPPVYSTDQAHLRKYLTTLGIAIAAGTLSLAGLFLRLEQDLLVTRSQFRQLTPPAQLALARRQQYLEVGTLALPYFVAVGLACGIGLAGYGLVGWARRQKIADARESIGLQRDEAELRRMTEGERAEKLDLEARESAADIVDSVVLNAGQRASVTSSDSVAESPGGSTDDVRDDKSGQQLVAEMRVNVSDIEREMLEKLRSAFPEPNDVSAHLRAATPDLGAVYIDALAKFNGLRIVFELKYAPGLSRVNNRVYEGLQQVARAAVAVGAEGALIMVVADRANREEVEVWQGRANRLATEYRSVRSALIIRRADFAALSPIDLLRRLNIAN